MFSNKCKESPISLGKRPVLFLNEEIAKFNFFSGYESTVKPTNLLFKFLK